MEQKYLVAVGSSHLVELIITEDIARMCYHCGSCDKDVEQGIEIPFIKEQLDKVDTELMQNVVNEILGEVEKPLSRKDLESWILFEASALFIDGDFEVIND